ncbi:MAG TPA: HEAT repeat domain-containing protein [Longimicrobiaceae bacterium]|nr:HEAT repeat domain-containing protein [Longimicrobiaceae bacterium]
MKHAITWLALAAALASTDALAHVAPAPPAPGAFSDGPEDPPPARHPQDPADALYRTARTALSQNDYRRAAQLFRQIADRHPRSAYTPDAYYWEAFALYRIGGSANLRAALERLESQRGAHPRAASRGDADVLVTRVRGELARLGDAGAAEQVSRQASRTAESCPQERDEVRTAALNALLQMNAEQALPILRQVLARRDACSAKLRERAVFLVAEKRTADTESLLLDVARSDPDRRVREQAVFWLSEIPTERAVATLEQILRTSSDSRIREKALFALSRHRSPRAARLLREAAEQSDLPVDLRANAIFWLHENRSAENVAYLRDLYRRLDRPELKEKALFSLSQMRGQGNDRWLLGVALEAGEPIQMRKKALFWASESGAPAAEIVNVYDRAQDRPMREHVIFVLSQRPEPAALDKLISIARSDRDPHLRKKAVFWLSQSKDPRAARVLQEIIAGE